MIFDLVIVCWLLGLTLVFWQHMRRDRDELMVLLGKIEVQDNRIGDALERIDNTLHLLRQNHLAESDARLGRSGTG